MKTRAAIRVIVTTALAAAGAPSIAADAPGGADAGALEEVTVTAQRRSENLQSTPLSVTAISGDALERRQVTEVSQIMAGVPNLTGAANTGQRTALSFFIRGVGSTESLATVDPTVGVYVDGVYIARQGVNNFSLLDIERVEVLRGPQGTLYGRNTNGGAVKVVTREPAAEQEFSVEGTVGNFERRDLKLVGNVPLSERTAVRASFLAQQADGYSRNLTLGRDVNDLDYYGGRIALKSTLSDRLELLAHADYSRDDTDGMYPSDVSGLVRPRTGSIYEVASGRAAENRAQAYGADVSLKLAVTEATSLTSLTAYRATMQDYAIDLSDQPVPIYLLGTDVDSRQVSQEFQVESGYGDALKYVAGLFLFKEQSDLVVTDDLNLYSPISPQGRRVRQPQFRKVFDVEVRSAALFGQATYAFTPSLEGIVGLRYTWEEREADVVQTVGGAPGFDTASLTALGVDMKPSYTKLSPKFGLNYTIADGVMGYLTYAQGFKSGSWQARVNNAQQFKNFEPEIVNSVELGLKSQLFDDRVRANFALFDSDYKDLFNTLPGAGGSFVVATADARIYGAEAELTWRATPALDLYSNVGFLHTAYEDLSPALDAQLGDVIQRSPKWTIDAGVNYRKPVGRGEIFVNGSYNYRTEYYVNPQNSPAAKTGEFGLVDVSLGYRGPDDRYRVTLSCRNCGDEEYVVNVINFPTSGFISAYAGEPRTYQVAVRLNFY
jgi:iron complex outermembrane receptor protein